MLALINKGRDLGVMFQGNDPRMNASLARQSRDQKMRSNIKSNIPDGSTNEDKYPEGTRQMEAMKYLKRKLLPTL